MSARGDVVVLGGGAHAVLVGTLLQRDGYRLRGYVSPMPCRGEGRVDVLGDWLGDDDWLAGSGPRTALVVNGIGSTSRPDARRSAYLSAVVAGYTLLSMVHVHAVLDRAAVVGGGLQALAMAVVQPGCTIGENVLINTAAVVEHDVSVGNHAHIAPRACVCGGASIGDNVHVGAGAVVLEGRRVADGAVVGAGAVVTRDVPENTVVVGIPARELNRKRNT